MENNEIKTTGQWRCNNCNSTKGVTNGLCPKCGPTQTVPLDEDAKKLSGFYEAEAEKAKQAEAEKVENTDSDATDPVK